MKLYYTPGTGRPARVAWLLEELGASYEAISVGGQDRDSPEHLARHPLGRVPALEFDDGQTAFDSTALVLHVADLNPDSGLLGAPGSPERAQAYQWILTAMTEMENAVIQYVYRDERTDGGEKPRAKFVAVAQAVGAALDGSEYLVGGRFGVADIVTGGVLGVAHYPKLMPDAAPELAEYYARLTARPAFERAARRTESLLLSV